MINEELCRKVESYVRRKGAKEQPLNALRICTGTSLSLVEVNSCLRRLFDEGRVIKEHRMNQDWFHAPKRDYKAEEKLEIEAEESVPDPQDYAEDEGLPDNGREAPVSVEQSNNYVCDVCGRGFERACSLGRHRKANKCKPRGPTRHTNASVYVPTPEPILVNASVEPKQSALSELSAFLIELKKHGVNVNVEVTMEAP